jgi:hypothetical protein
MHPCHACSVDPKGPGFLLWAVATGFEASHCTADDERLFIHLLRLLVDEGGADINQRLAPSGGTPLMFVTRAGIEPAVRAIPLEGRQRAPARR